MDNENKTTFIEQISVELPRSNLYVFFLSLVGALLWTIYLAYYNTRIIGLIAQFVVNKLCKMYKYGAHVNIGSLSVSVLSGKIMFRAVHYITEDYSIRIEYGWIIFKWWRPYIYRKVGEDMSHAETRMFVFIDGLEVHSYNKSATYTSLQKLFGLHTGIIDEEDDEDGDKNGNAKTGEDGAAGNKNSATTPKKNLQPLQWRDLIPVCKLDITTCRFVFGNSLTPHALIMHLDESHVTYTTTTASTPFDEFMHDLKVKSDALKIMFVRSDKYTGEIVDEPPRMMGEGFVLMQSSDVKLHFYRDEPGLVPYEPEMVRLADGETVTRRTYPSICLDVQCGKNTDFNYGPWADRQREYLWKFFYPSDFQSLVPTKIAEPGEQRQFRSFEFRMNIVTEATNDVLFTKNSVTQAIHMNMGQGSYIEASIPWITEESGYVSVVRGQLLLLEATTSMRFRSLLECETLDFNVTGSYPLPWNGHQDWKCSFTACKATVFLIFEHKHFFSDLVADWSTKCVPDVFHFVPYTYNINILINQFELVTLCNEYNWIDTSSQSPENAHIAFCGEMFDLSLQLPYTDFMPITNTIGFIFKVENVFCRLYLPENNTSRHVIIALSENMKIVDRDGKIMEKPFCFDIKKQWRRLTERSQGWIDCWMTSNVSLTINYKYHPMPPLLKRDTHHLAPPTVDDLISTPGYGEAEHIPLGPIRSSGSVKVPENFDAGEMKPDLISVELEVAPSVLCVYGSLLRNFLHVKENYLGEDQRYTDFYDNPSTSLEIKEPDGVLGPLTEKEVAEKEFDPREYRPFAVTVSVTLHDIQAHLLKNCNLENVPCPSVYMERVGFELDKGYRQTKLQVLISPAVLMAGDNLEREPDQTHLKDGYLALSGLQVRGHAMFSHEGLALDSETLEYAWLVEAIIGDVSGRLTCPQIQNLVEVIQTFIMLVEDVENSLQRSVTYQLCQHMVPQPQCKKLQPRYAFTCPSSEDIKYRMTRASVDSINLFIVEGGSALNVVVFPVRLSMCNLHGENTRSGITGLIEHVSLKQYISTAPIRHDTNQPEIWLESGGVSLGPIKAEAAMALPIPEFHELQNDFLILHDEMTMRLWFLWPADTMNVQVMGKCGCLGGCSFFGNNRNGIGFFHPKKIQEHTPTAVCRVSPDGTDPGFGQSLLYKNRLLFETDRMGWGSPGRDFSFTRGYMSNLTTPETPGTSITLVEDMSHINAGKSGEKTQTTPESKSRLSRSQTGETQSSSSVTTTTTPSDTTIGDSVGTNPFDTLRSSDSVILRMTESADLRVSNESRAGNEDLGNKSVRSVSLSSSSSPPPFSPASRKSFTHSPSSRSSIQSPSGRSSIQSSSPGHVRRSKHYDPARQTSTMSLDSEMYFSAEEDALSSSDPKFPPLKQPSFPDVHSSESESVVWGNEGTSSPGLVMDKTLKSAGDETVLERRLSTSSNSTLSYLSADTDPDETMSGGIPEELSMVDLHGQVNKAITKSPVLLPCYSGHLTKLLCQNWSSPAPFPSRYHGVSNDPSHLSLSSAGQSQQHGQTQSSLPHFVKTKQGFSTRIMKAKEMMFPAEGADEGESGDNIEEPLLDTVDGTTPDNVCRTTATVKLRGSIDVLLTPLLLESFQRLCEAVTPTLTSLHPSSILDGLHSRCLDTLKSQNRLKKGDSGLEPETPDSDGPEEEPGTSSEARFTKSSEMKTSSYQALISLPKINICALQAGLVEEQISFSALDNIQELTCVSLVGVCIEDIRCQLLRNSHSCKNDKGVFPNLLNSSPATAKVKFDGAEPEKDDVPEILREEDVGTVTVKAIHLQLRRLLKDSNFSENIVLTAIPEHKSKVMFTFENDVTKLFSPVSARSGTKVRRSASVRTERDGEGKRPPLNRHISHDAHSVHSFRNGTAEANPFDAAPKPKLLRQKSLSKEKPEELIQQKARERLHDKQSIGYIMFECGLEDISITAVRRLGYKDQVDERLAGVEATVEETQYTARHDMESQGHSSSSQSKGHMSQGHSSSSASQGPSPGDTLLRSRGDSSGGEKAAVILGSQEFHVSSNSVHSWDSRVSIPSDAGIAPDHCPLVGDASSGTLHLKTVWFIFAAPPPLPIKRKADFTKYDWNLLSTATPAINAWLTPSDRMMTAVRTLVQELNHRTNCVMACIMTEGLEVQKIHMPYKSKFSRITTFSKTLQEDASCQLLTVLRRYIHMLGTATVEQAVTSDSIPQLITIQKGILALTRQWKNVLYMPYLSHMSFKTRKQRPYTVSFAMPETVGGPFSDDDDDDDDDDDIVCNDGEPTVKYNVVDERVSVLDEEEILLKGESDFSLNQPRHSSPQQRYGDAARDPSASHPAGMSRASSVSGHQKAGKQSKAPPAPRMYESPQRDTNPHMTSLLRNDSVYSFHSASGMSVDGPVAPTPPPTPYKGDGTKYNMLKSKVDDLYRWMIMQQSGFESHPLEDDPPPTVRRQDSFLEAFGRGANQEDSHLDISAEQCTLGTSIMQLADAKNLFKPFLQSLGLHVENVRPTAMLKNFGGNLSLQGKLDVLKIQIADSVKMKSKGKGKAKRNKYSDGMLDMSAFLCEKFSLRVSMQDLTDFDKKNTESDSDRIGKFPFKFAMHKLEAKPATLQVNVLIDCHSVTQNVDMPLLRLIHQFVTILGNVNETRIELKQGHSTVDWIRTHRKQDSKGSSSSAETVHSDISRTGMGVGKIEEPTLSSSKTNLAQETTKPLESHKQRLHKPSISSFKFPFDTIRPERLGFSTSLKKSNLKVAKDSKKSKDSKSPGGRSEVLTPPQSLNLSESVNIDMAETSSPALADKTIVEEIKEGTPRCWRTLYHLLELYSTMPETKTIGGHRANRDLLPVIEEEPSEKANTSTPSGSVKTRLDLVVEEEAALGTGLGSSGGYENTPLARSTFSRTRFKQSIYIGDSVPLVVFGVAKLDKVRILAVLSGLKLEAELRGVHATGTIKEKVKGFLQRKSSESSFTVHVGHTMLVLLEGPTLQTVVTVNVAKSQALQTTVKRRGKGHNSVLVSIGVIEVDIPQHPVVLHGMLTRGTNQLSTTLQEFRRPISRTSRNVDMEHGTLDSRGSGSDQARGFTQPHHQSSRILSPTRSRNVDMEHGTLDSRGSGSDQARGFTQPHHQSSRILAPDKKAVMIHIHLKAVLQGITIGAALLPSLTAQHKTGPITISGITLKKARFTLDLPHHTLSFKSKVTTKETSIPSSASIDLPPIHVYADYRHYSANAPVSEALTEGLMLKEGNYLNAVAEVGMFEHSLTTDLLNHLVFVQKVFMKEVNELLQKVSGGDRPVPIWSDPSGEVVKPSQKEQILYSFHFRLKGIQITATTPTASAVRLETEAIDLEVSNRVQMASQEANPNIVYEDNQKVFIKAQVDLNLALGQLIKNPMFEEADPEFQTMAFFKTKIAIRNALQDEMIPGVSTDQEALLITLTRPIVLAQPMAFDKAVLVWLNYKNAYEYWTEQRLALNKEVQTATRQVIDRLPQITPNPQQVLSTLFLQLTVDDMGLCLPIAPTNAFGPTSLVDSEPGAAVVLTLESTQISACSSGSLVSKGKFTDFCLRIVEDFETSLDDWKPSKDDLHVMNACVVPEGTYEVCSCTINKQSTDPNGNAKWILNIKWDMEGIDVHLDTNIGKLLSAVGNALTSLTGTEEDEDFFNDQEERLDVSLEDMTDLAQTEPFLRRPSVLMDSLPKFMFDTSLDPKQRARMLEHEMNEQAKHVQDLKDRGESAGTIEAETRKLEELKGLIFHDFRKDVISKIKKQSERASVIKDKLGIGVNPAHIRSKSFGGRADEKHRESAPPDILKQDTGHIRGNSVSKTVSEMAPAKVQFGETTSATYTPPQTPDSTPEHTFRKHEVQSRRTQSLMVPGLKHELLTSSSSSANSTTEDSFSSEDENRTVFKGDSSEADTMRRSGSDQKTTSNPSIGSGGSKLEPNVDFELDIKVFIDSGKVVLHPKDSKDDEGKRNKREKTPTTDPLGSPTGKRKMKKQETSSQLPSSKKHPAPQQPVIENTVFFMPGVDVKVHYNSKTDYIGSPANTLEQLEVKLDESSASNSARPRQSVKKASIYAFLSLQPLPQEMVISPCLLDYLEQALEPIPYSLMSQGKKAEPVLDNVLPMDLNTSSASLGAPNFLGSFPVDVMVLIRVEPSIIRFNCLPTSRVECLLQVPNLELVFSTKKSELESGLSSDGTPPLKAKFNKKISRERNLSGGSRDSRTRAGSTASELATSMSSGGLSVTGLLSDFSLYIFHPYGGGGQRKPGPNVSPRYLGSIQEQSVLNEITRKDSLSLNVEFINLNISRTRKLEIKAEGPSSEKSNVVRFSAVCNIGTAAFKYDMRRLSEILSFPKSWYRRNLARRLFLGDESWIMEDEGKLVKKKRRSRTDSSSLSSTASSCAGGVAEWEGLSASNPTLAPPLPKPCTSSPTLHVPLPSDLNGPGGHHRRGSSGDKIKVQISQDFKNEIADRLSEKRGTSAPVSPNDAQHGTAPPADVYPTTSATAGPQPGTPSIQSKSSKTGQPGTGMQSRRGSQQQAGKGGHSGSGGRSTGERKTMGWQTLVLYTVNLSQLNVHVNMSNVMGNTVWNTRDIRSQGRLSIDSTGHKNLRICVGLGGSHFDSKGGVIGGNVDLQEISTYFEVSEDPKLGNDPVHMAGVSMYALEGRVDYMGSSVLMARLSDMHLDLRDEWKIEKSHDKDAPLATTRQALLFAHGDLGWDKFHILISRSTTPDLIKIASKLEEFIMHQFTSSRRALGTMGPIPASVRQKMQEKHKSGDEDSFLSELRHHRHWQKALGNITGCRFSMLPVMLPKEGMILGGTLTLRGNNMTLGCFHGINFRSKSWAVFTLSEPYICFATEAQKTEDEGTHVVQDLTFYVGHDMTSHTQGKHMAYVMKMSRGHSMPPTFTSAHEWFHYAFTTPEIKDLDEFPTMNRAGSESPSDYRKSRKYTDYNHDSEMIFQLPSLQLLLKSTHHQAEREPCDEDPKPVVECSFVTEFEDHIFVAMDAEVLLFVHDLVMSYIREKDKGTRTSSAGAGPSSGKSAKSPVEGDKKKMTDPLAVLQQDWREYECKTWHLEPTVRLLHWASKQIDPVGVDYVLQKLGFSHARVTIPKWMQRGFMDPSDKILSMLVNKLIVILRETPDKAPSPK